ncbi:chorismate mutase [Clostridium sp. 19966]|uniref:chorismate mutase n=1 Tax=Clostridium sp. 19966 TaxID=2768166 RepID=UPI0028DF7311|nr:chorismate mutase [Clostridium sp. 19966]MDT8716373.1 chorismate mutase [Clostridium sp. 19966]
MKDLEQYRNEIDSLDKDLIKLLERRFELSIKIGEYKKLQGLPVLNEEREKEVIKKNLALISNLELKEPLENILKYIMKQSRNIQKTIK